MNRLIELALFNKRTTIAALVLHAMAQLARRLGTGDHVENAEQRVHRGIGGRHRRSQKIPGDLNHA